MTTIRAARVTLPQQRSPLIDLESANGIDPEQLTVVKSRHPWRWVASAAMLVLVAVFINGLVTNPGWDWPTLALLQASNVDGGFAADMLAVRQSVDAETPSGPED